MKFEKIHNNDLWYDICRVSGEYREDFVQYLEELSEEFDEGVITKIKHLARRNKFISPSRYRITKNSIPLARKIRKELNLYVFPYIEISGGKGWNRSGGTWGWFMFNLVNGSNGSTDTPRMCLLKRNHLYLLDSGEITT